MFTNKNILITGGTGSFGKKFIKILLEKYPKLQLQIGHFVKKVTTSYFI